MTPTLPLVLPLLLSTLATIAAFPLPIEPRALSKRSPSSHDVGVGFAITISIIIFAAIVFYLGVRRGQTGTYFCWRNPPAVPLRSPTSLSEKISIVDPHQFKSRISCPVPIHSSALPELSPVDVQPAPRFLELSSEPKAIYEMGQPSPRHTKRPSADRKSHFDRCSRSRSSSSSAKRYTTASRKSQSPKRHTTASRKSQSPKCHTMASRKSRGADRKSLFDRKSWFCKSAMEVESEAREKSPLDEDERGVDPPSYPGSVMLRPETEAERGEMDWSGMEWLRRVYVGRKSMKSVYRSEV
ncbi:hypothetical protein BU26DRAFT_522704 [Trematosphaeria pertusa]|uniref:Uncharacterized protein n=1 Tax=Trematosphaeria pertusa TaxID=390896 RepID=A0A6A6I401_9PLEO|nr:uncharacterized protein BU26DRAFT_522704 [Trematosphaeria pertusa]KAF2245006.1 hypothetical protein BU26DRAFT_522704 [Trematosphaeria pertusa]